MADWMTRYRRFETQAAGMHPEVSVDDFNYTIYVSPRYKYAYAFTPKAGCTTLKRILTDAEFGEEQPYVEQEDVHYREFLPFLKMMQVGDPKVFLARPDIFTFCFVRNPYTRLLSAYLDKIVGKKGQHQAVLQALGQSDHPDYEISFAEFVKVVCAQSIEEQDQHWRVQYYMTYQAGIRYDFVGRFERLNEDIEKVLGQLGLEKYFTAALRGSKQQKAYGQQHATGADQKISQYYTPQLQTMVYQKFEIDFEYFRYSPLLP